MSGPVTIICGGTGGHLAPGIATAQRLHASGTEVCLVVSKRDIDGLLLKKYPELKTLPVSAAPFSIKPIAFIRFLIQTARGLGQAFSALRKDRPPVVLSFGGYLTFSFVLTAWFLKIPIVLHEANRKPGRAVRFFAGAADRVFFPEGVRLRRVEPARLRHLGMPLREEIQHIRKEQIRQRMGIPLSTKVLVVVGGSQGAKALNDWIEKHAHFMAADGIWVILVAGPGKLEGKARESVVSDLGNTVCIERFAFHEAMHELLSTADLVVSRAGAGTIAELVRCRAPSILVPYPYAADDHQLYNARYVEQRGGAVAVDQRQIDSLYREVLDLIFNDWMLRRLRLNLDRMDPGDEAERFASWIKKRYIDAGAAAADPLPPVSLTGRSGGGAPNG
jgi:UDP-N-acetylglucosamine--N-acetylmuramyl-(pentapeptide) pyrophosphoryl-undecaprenol N-acetylglucosamine transferase